MCTRVMKCFRFGRHKEGNAEARWGRTSGHCKVNQESQQHNIPKTANVIVHIALNSVISMIAICLLSLLSNAWCLLYLREPCHSVDALGGFSIV